MKDDTFPAELIEEVLSMFKRGLGTLEISDFVVQEAKHKIGFHNAVGFANKIKNLKDPQPQDIWAAYSDEYTSDSSFRKDR